MRGDLERRIAAQEARLHVHDPQISYRIRLVSPETREAVAVLIPQRGIDPRDSMRRFTREPDETEAAFLARVDQQSDQPAEKGA